MKFSISKSVLTLTMVVLIAGCGGGGSTTNLPHTSTPEPNQAPIVNVGEDFNANEQDTVTLSGSATDSDGSVASYSWTQMSGTVVALTGADTAQAQFVAQPTLITYKVSMDFRGTSGGELIEFTDSVTLVPHPQFS